MQFEQSHSHVTLVPNLFVLGAHKTEALTAYDISSQVRAFSGNSCEICSTKVRVISLKPGLQLVIIFSIYRLISWSIKIKIFKTERSSNFSHQGTQKNLGFHRKKHFSCLCKTRPDMKAKHIMSHVLCHHFSKFLLWKSWLSNFRYRVL